MWGPDNMLIKCDSEVNVQYLGFTFSSKKKDDNDILRQLRMLHTESNRLLRLFHHCSVDVKLALFRSYCTCFYCPFLWSNMDTLQKNIIIVSSG